MLKWILVILVLTIALRIVYIPSGAVSFHYDMARDAYAALQIWNGDLKIQGPPTSTPGLYHGPLYYYLLAPIYGLGGGDPRVVAIFFSLINALVVIPVMFLARDIFKSDKWAILSGIFFVFSFENTQYGPWISNPAPAVLTVALFFLFLLHWQKGKEYGLYLAIISAALSVQFQFFLIYLLFLIPVFGYLFKIKTNFKQKINSIFITLVGLSSFFVAALKFGNLQNFTGGFFNIATAGQIDFRSQFSALALNYLDKFSETFIYNFFPTNVFLGGLLAFLSLILLKNKLLFFYLFFNLPIFIFGGHSNTYANLGLVVGAILAVLNTIKIIAKKSVILAAALILLLAISNLYAIFKNGPLGQVILVIPNDMVLKNQLKLIDETYQKAAGQAFSINTLTLPLWTNTTWSYLYSWYGQKKYGYVPKFLGHNQVGLLGANALEKIDQPLEKTFFIIEPHVGIPDDIYNLEIGAEDSKSKLISETKYGELRLQFRMPKNE